MPMLDLNGLRFHYQQRGSGPDVILIHAVTSNLSVWLFSNVLDILAREFRVTAYDMRGHGASSVPPDGYTSADMAQDLRGLHSALGLGPAILVGHSYGAVVATHAAWLYPDMVRGLVLSDPFFAGLADIEPNLAEMEGWRDVRAALVAAGAELGTDVDLTRLFQAIAGLTPVQKERIRETMGETALRWFSQLPQLARTTCGQDVFAPAGLTAERLREIRQPLVALYDEHTSFGATREFLRNNLANVTIDTVPGARHLAPLQSTEDFTRLVLTYCRRLAGA
ncbi:alpha/beta hydrolase [Enterovirga sp.]|uniref:alpha/beta fold hydrolase n=1 Tax=Enterovirga sp. TaxID=2026350 RepID=UPI002CE701A8|nr:alpha/beta hydrolase [Enterovirga sp.]HMO28103.1 alpha/beta hydrolase [Enterovirga sp.]